MTCLGGTMPITATREEIDRASAGQTVPSRFLTTAAEQSGQVALRWKTEDGGWGELTYAGYADLVARVTSGLQALGVGRGDRVVLMMRNRPEFHVVDLAVSMLGATPISIYNSSSPEQVQYLASHCGATVAVAEDLGFLERFLKVRSELPDLRSIVVLEDPDGMAPEDVVRYDTLLAAEPADLDALARAVKPEDLATVIYTSGTTGPPKGVMLSHSNICWTIESYMPLLQIEPVGFRVVSYLPMAHIAERMSSHYLGLAGGYEVTTCPNPGDIAAYAREVHPQIMFGVPRVWEKIYAGVQGALAADAERKAKFDEAVAAAIPLRLKATRSPLTDEEQQTLDFLDEVAFKGVRELIGLDQLTFAVSGAAPIPPEMLEWFVGIGIPMSEIYGMSENTGPLTWDPYEIKPGTVGRAMPGSEVQLAEDGEVIARGGHVFQGYLNDPGKTADALDEDGWLHTGDIGEMDDEGFLRIVDRKKELIITAGGKNISPANLEAALKMIPLVGQACAIGDKRPFVSALVVLDTDVAPAWASQRGIDATDLASMAEHPEVVAEVEQALAQVMSQFNNAERVKKVRILAEEWQPDSEELTPTSKLKRRGIHAKYEAEIEAIYS
jgi:long-chain acyl-CoA synthetase